jgi:hypothetical protein
MLLVAKQDCGQCMVRVLSKIEARRFRLKLAICGHSLLQTWRVFLTLRTVVLVSCLLILLLRPLHLSAPPAT